MRQVICWFVYIEKNPRFTGFLDSNLHTRLAIVTENELGLAFPPRNLPQKIRRDPSTFYLVIVATNRQTDRQTYAGDYIIPRQSFRGDNNRRHLYTLKVSEVPGSEEGANTICGQCLLPVENRNSRVIKCDTCRSLIHQYCTHMSEKVFAFSLR